MLFFNVKFSVKLLCLCSEREIPKVAFKAPKDVLLWCRLSVQTTNHLISVSFSSALKSVIYY